MIPIVGLGGFSCSWFSSTGGCLVYRMCLPVGGPLLSATHINPNPVGYTGGGFSFSRYINDFQVRRGGAALLSSRGSKLSLFFDHSGMAGLRAALPRVILSPIRIFHVPRTFRRITNYGGRPKSPRDVTCCPPPPLQGPQPPVSIFSEAVTLLPALLLDTRNQRGSGPDRPQA